MKTSFSPLAWLLTFASRLRFPQLFLLTAAVFGLDLFIPDMIPFVDEVLLGLMTALLGSMRRRNGEPSTSSEKEKDENQDKSGT